MKHILPPTLALLLTGFIAHAAPLKGFILAGQSNMQTPPASG